MSLGTIKRGLRGCRGEVDAAERARIEKQHETQNELIQIIMAMD